MQIWLTSDTHFSHQQAFLYEPRGFSSVNEMNQKIVEYWNSIVKEEDIIYHLGDLCLSNNQDAIKYIKKLNGTIKWIRGNHCSTNRVLEIQDNCNNIHIIGDMNTSYSTIIKHGKLTCYLSHYPVLTANYDDKHFNQHVINFHGHIHSRTPWINLRNPFMYDVGMDAHDCYPVHIETAIADIRNRWNEIGQLPTSIKPENTYPYGVMI